MPTKTKSPVPAAIKWTDEEWTKLAAHIRAVKGNDILLSPHLEEIKARDVFDAQMATLPADRHRKLVSIAQGFQTIRDRLRLLFHDMSAPQHQDELFPKGRAGKKPARANPEATVRTDMLEAPEDSTAGAGGDEAVDASGAGAETGEVPRTDGAEAGPSTSVDYAPFPAAGAGPARIRPEEKAGVQPESVQPAFAPAADPAVGQFIDMARPFVSMVCQEFARALVRALADKGAGEVLGAFGQAGGQPPAMRKNETRSKSGNPGAPWPAPLAASSAPGAAYQADREPNDEEADNGHEPQPLFDPKLPPSPNSDFKPTIGLVGANEREAQDLQALYPQLQLVSVRADAIKHVHVFQRCQRVIGMQDAIPAPTDEFLGRSLRHRYVRILGGMERVREQLNAWLDKPGSLNSRPARTPHREGKGAGNSFLKKRQHRRPS